MGMTMTQKILAAAAGLDYVEAGQLIEADLDLVLGNDITSPVAIKEMEKTNPQKAIKEYEKYVESGSDKDAPYKRLAVLYRKLNQYDNEIAVLEKAIEVLSEKKPGKEEWFVKRLNKMR